MPAWPGVGGGGVTADCAMLTIAGPATAVAQCPSGVGPLLTFAPGVLGRRSERSESGLRNPLGCLDPTRYPAKPAYPGAATTHYTRTAGISVFG